MLDSLNSLHVQGIVIKPLLIILYKLGHNLLPAYFAEYNLRISALVLTHILQMS